MMNGEDTKGSGDMGFTDHRFFNAGVDVLNNPPLLRWLIAFAFIFVAGAAGFALPTMGARLTLPILPSGIAVAATYCWGRRMWPAVFAAGVAIDLFGRQPLVASLGVGVGLAAGAVFTTWFLERRGFDSGFSRAKDVPLFILAAGMGMTLAPTFGLLGFYLSGSGLEASNALPWIRWWANTTAGVILVGPIFVADRRQSLARFTKLWVEGALWLLGVAVCCCAILFASEAIGRPLLLVFSILLIVVSSIRFGLVIAAIGALAISTTSAISFAFGLGVFSPLGPLQGLVTIWSLSVALTGLSLIVTALLAERDAAGIERLRADRRYAQIFDGSPQPIWVHDRNRLKFLLVNEAAVRQYGWSRAEFLANSLTELAPAGEPRILPEPEEDQPHAGAATGTAAEPFEARHLTRDGRVLEVEVWTRSIDFGGQPAELVFAIDVTERRAFGQALMEAIAGEQRRIAQEMHDGLGQELTGLALSVRALANRALREREAISGDLDQLASLATSCIQDAQRIVQGLSPLTDSDGSLEAALDALARRSSLSGTQVQFVGHNEARLTFDLKARNHLYRIAQEAVQNALKHSGARTIEIELRVRLGGIRLSISDDGRGFLPEAVVGTGLGLRTMRFRASAIGGKLLIGRGSKSGNSVVCEVPQARVFAATG
jgi:PAS domain S-box-containing protein